MALSAANKLPLALAAPLLPHQLRTARRASVFPRTYPTTLLGSAGRPEDCYYDLWLFSERLPTWLLGSLGRQISLLITQILMQRLSLAPNSPLPFFFFFWFGLCKLVNPFEVVTFPNRKVAPRPYSIACFSIDFYSIEGLQHI